MSNLRLASWLRSLRPPRPRRGRGPIPSATAAERLEDRSLLTAGQLLWWGDARGIEDLPAEVRDFRDVAVQADGKIVAVGHAPNDNDDDFLVARFTAQGRLDRSFWGTGWQTFDFGDGRDDRATAVAIQPDGSIVVGGNTTDAAGKTDFGLVRVGRYGALDLSFGIEGFVRTSWGGSSGLAALALSRTGGIVAAGMFRGTDGTLTDGAVARYSARGVLDPSFDGNGVRLLPRYVTDVAVDSADRVVLAAGGGKVTRLTSSGAYDASFNGNGEKAVGFGVGSGNAVLTAVAVDGAGRIVVGGHAYDGAAYRPGAARLSSTGAYDEAFDSDGRVTFDIDPERSDYVRDLALLSNGGVVLGGENADSSNRRWFVTVLDASGGLDARFGTDGKSAIGPPGSDSPFERLAVTKSGDYVLAGRESFADPDLPDAPELVSIRGVQGRRDDLLGWTAGGEWWVATSNDAGTAFENRYFGRWNPDAGWKIVDTADFNGDGLADVAGRDAAGQWWVGVNYGRGIPTSVWGRWNEAAKWRDVRFADFDGDGRADVAARTYYGEWWVSLSTGSGFRGATRWDGWSEAAGWRDVIAADFTGDGRADLAGRASNGEWWVGTSTGAKFTQARWDVWSEAAKWRDVRVGDFDGDGRKDLAGRTYYGEWWVARSTGKKFAKARWGAWSEAAGWQDVRVGDFDGDGRSDLVGRASNGECYVARSSDGNAFVTSKWETWVEAAGWKDVRVGDFDGDGRDDVAARSTVSTSAGRWYVARSTLGFFEPFSFRQTAWGGWAEAAGWRTFVQDEFAPTPS